MNVFARSGAAASAAKPQQYERCIGTTHSSAQHRVLGVRPISSVGEAETNRPGFRIHESPAASSPALGPVGYFSFGAHETVKQKRMTDGSLGDIAELAGDDRMPRIGSTGDLGRSLRQ